MSTASHLQRISFIKDYERPHFCTCLLWVSFLTDMYESCLSYSRIINIALYDFIWIRRKRSWNGTQSIVFWACVRGHGRGNYRNVAIVCGGQTNEAIRLCGNTGGWTLAIISNRRNNPVWLSHVIPVMIRELIWYPPGFKTYPTDTPLKIRLECDET